MRNGVLVCPFRRVGDWVWSFRRFGDRVWSFRRAGNRVWSFRRVVDWDWSFRRLGIGFRHLELFGIGFGHSGGLGFEINEFGHSRRLGNAVQTSLLRGLWIRFDHVLKLITAKQSLLLKCNNILFILQSVEKCIMLTGIFECTTWKITLP